MCHMHLIQEKTRARDSCDRIHYGHPLLISALRMIDKFAQMRHDMQRDLFRDPRSRRQYYTSSGSRAKCSCSPLSRRPMWTS